MKKLTLAVALSLAAGYAFAADATPKTGSDYLLIVQESATAFAGRSDAAKCPCIVSSGAVDVRAIIPQNM